MSGPQRARQRVSARTAGCVLKPALTVPLAAAVVALAAVYAYHIASQTGDMLLVQALHGSSAPVRAAAALGLRKFDRCPDNDFAPASAIGMLIAAWDGEVPPQRIHSLLRQLQAIGCDINKHGDHGLAPLHSAILFNNVAAVRVLLQAGADPTVRTRLARTDGGSGAYDAQAFAARLANTGEENYDAIMALFATPETPRLPAPPAGVH